ncbi:hypothetical protein NDU88_007312 [Pleurodeles waltl]|uniref:Uncharacterized protein n=1 Tax=Pleurodeles waltl TaxID=8319 RepID=A0AAV7UQ39_PLEWA|nr:hypothetical protein NDU88_007312 [Pleurodeles waltl]
MESAVPNPEVLPAVAITLPGIDAGGRLGLKLIHLERKGDDSSGGESGAVEERLMDQRKRTPEEGRRHRGMPSKPKVQLEEERRH